MLKTIPYFFLFITFFACSQKKSYTKEDIIQEHVYDCADKINYRIQMKEYQDCLDAGLKKDSTIAYLWQQKAMPYFKIKKYEAGMQFLNNAVKYDAKTWLDYRGFIKCIFAKTYKEAIIDFEKIIKIKGNQYVQDHTYRFYIGISYLQLNEFEKAEITFEKDIKEQIEKRGEAHFLDLFYYGISKYEQQKWEEAINLFDQSLKQYTNFSDVQYYKSKCLERLGKKADAQLLFENAKKNAALSYTINEDNSVYETYPYKVKW